MESIIKETDLIHTKVMNKGFSTIHKKDIILSEFAMGHYFFSDFAGGDRVFVIGSLNNQATDG